MAEKLAAELLDAATGQGATIKQDEKKPTGWRRPTGRSPITAGS